MADLARHTVPSRDEQAVVDQPATHPGSERHHHQDPPPALPGAAPVQPKTAVIDSGVDLQHPLLKRFKESKNATSGENVDDIGHGTWVHSTVLHMAPWSKNTTHYKTFLNGSATTDDILKAVYAKAGAADRYKASFYPGPHKFDLDMQKEAFAWFDRWLRG